MMESPWVVSIFEGLSASKLRDAFVASAYIVASAYMDDDYLLASNCIKNHTIS